MPQDDLRLDHHARDPRGGLPAFGAGLRRPLARLLLGLVIVASLLTFLPADQAEAGWSTSRTTGEYTPQRVWQMKKNCVWAAGAMLLDKWTHGSVRVSQSVLRRASHDKKGGSSLYDLSRGIAAVTGIRIPYSPSNGDTMAWWQLLDRLAHGGGAVLIGEYRDLPAHYTRWNRAFAGRRNTSHAVYIQTYDRARGRVWLMDPLADGHYPGEWIDVRALHRFATIEDGKVMAATTPAGSQPQTAPLSDHAYRLAGPRLSGAPVAGSSIRVQVGLAITQGFPQPGAYRMIARWVPLARPEPPAQASRSRAVVDTSRSPGALLRLTPVEVATASAPDRAGRRGFSLSLPVPLVPGRYRLAVGLAEVGHLTAARSFKTMTIEVVAPYAASIAVPERADLVAGLAFTMKLTVANVGTVDWRTPTLPTEGPRPVDPVVQTRIVLTWRSARGAELPAAEVPAELAPGHSAKFAVDLIAPPDAGSWTLEVDVQNLVEGAMSSTGRDLPNVPVLITPKALASES